MIDGRWQRAQRLLCVRLDSLGDVLMTTPALRALKQSLPGSRITLLTSASGAAAARHAPEIDDIIEYAPPWMKSSAACSPHADLAMVGELARRRFDAAVIFTVYSQNPLPAALLCHLAGIPLRLAHCRENPYQLLTDWVREPEPQERIRHEVRRQLDLVGGIGAHAADERLSFHVSDADATWARQRLRTLGIDGARPWIVLHPGASAPSRRYPPHRWVELARALAARLRCPLLFTGDEPEVALVEQIRAGLPGTCSLAGQLELGRLGAVLALAPLLICNNTGPAHIAAALGTPVVSLYALTNPQHTPWQVPQRVLSHDVPCRNCYQSVCPYGAPRCLTEVTSAQIVDAALELLTMPASSAV